MIYPEFIKSNDFIGITACSDGKTDELDRKRMDNAKLQFNELEYTIIETKNCRESIKGRSSNATERIAQLENLLCNEDVSLIIMCSGGDYLIEIINKLNLSLFIKHPKWIQGYSDPTSLLYILTVNLELATVYGSNYGEFGMGEWHDSLKDNIKLLEGDWNKEKGFLQKSYSYCIESRQTMVTGFEGYLLTKEVNWKNIVGGDEIEIRGRMLGGCLDVLLNLVGTKYDKTKEFCEKYKEDGMIWYLESFDLNSERLYLALWTLKEAGWFDTVQGFVFGRPTFFSSAYEITYEETVLSVLEEFQVPIILGADFGHIPPRITIVNGAIGEIVCKNGKGELLQKFI